MLDYLYEVKTLQHQARLAAEARQEARLMAIQNIENSKIETQIRAIRDLAGINPDTNYAARLVGKPYKIHKPYDDRIVLESKKKLSFRETLQIEINNWLKGVKLN